MFVILIMPLEFFVLQWSQEHDVGSGPSFLLLNDGEFW